MDTITQSRVIDLIPDLALKADAVSPTFTGTPEAPTPAPGTNTTRIATTAFVMAVGILAAEQTIPGAVTWSGTPPTGETKVYQWSKNESMRMVTFWCHLVYTGAGAANGQVTFPLPTDMPDPIVPTGVTGASAVMYSGTGLIYTAINVGSTVVQLARLRRNAADNGFEFNLVMSGTLAAKYATITLAYPY